MEFELSRDFLDKQIQGLFARFVRACSSFSRRWSAALRRIRHPGGSRIINCRWSTDISHCDAGITHRALFRVKRSHPGSRDRRRRCRRHAMRCGQLFADLFPHVAATVPIQSAATNHPQTSRRHVFKPTAQKIMRSQPHQLLASIAMILVPKRHRFVGDAHQPPVRHRPAGHVASEIPGHGNTVRITFLHTHIPANSSQSVQQRLALRHRH